MKFVSHWKPYISHAKLAVWTFWLAIYDFLSLVNFYVLIFRSCCVVLPSQFVNTNRTHSPITMKWSLFITSGYTFQKLAGFRNAIVFTWFNNEKKHTVDFITCLCKSNFSGSSVKYRKTTHCDSIFRKTFNKFLISAWQFWQGLWVRNK
jgi:hypothetical protein